MTLKGLVTGVAAAAVVGGAAAGVTSIALPELSPATAVRPVVFGAPLSPAPDAPDLSGPLTDTLDGAVAPGTYTGDRGSFIEGGLGRLAGTADRQYNAFVAEGVFPVSFLVTDIVHSGPVVTSNVTLTTATGQTASAPVSFVKGPSRTGWQIKTSSVMDLLSRLG
jgi:hypothetical protein